jgi:hypothetical protein
MAAREQSRGEIRADAARSAGNQYAIAHKTAP